ncbi:MAG: hypothetical protein J6S60_07390 [Oscillospiraceae bacterium]|nr:hypothetical protein [Oscillospiraceae bacterium]
MGRELEGYRDNLARVEARFDHEMLTCAEVARWFGCKPEKVRRDFIFCPRTGRISKADLARQMCAR